MCKLFMLLQILNNMGFRYVGYRVLHLIRTKLGWYDFFFPKVAQQKYFINYLQWLDNKKAYFFDNGETKEIGFLLPEEEKRKISETASKIKEGIFLFFNSEEFSLGKSYNWVTNPLNGYVYPSNLHWSKINDYDSKSGDIKFVWEKSRFSFLYDLIRDEEINGNKHKDFVLSQIADWIDANPTNQGPNWKCSQEISIRVFNWIFALYYYSDKGPMNEELWQKILNSIYQQITHVRKHIDFSKIAVRNNHAITETLALYIVGLLFPWLDEKGEWKEKGKKWFEQEIEYQIYPDGTYLQFSMNYHRVVIQLLTKAIVISELNEEYFTDVVYERAYNSINFLFQCQNSENGDLPNYGSNDGALFFPLNNCNYRDFRPQLNVLHYVLTGKYLYNNGIWMEDAFWLTGSSKFVPKNYKPIEKQLGLLAFEKGGYYLIRENESLTFLRAGSHKDRPLQADNLHLDLWYKCDNILIDGGSYKYNELDKDLAGYFIGTQSHNTVMLENYDQMLKGGRFIWFYWTQLSKIKLEETDQYFIIDATISAFSYLDKKCKHQRIIKKQKNSDKWIIEDHIHSNIKLEMKQIWHTRFQHYKLIDFDSEFDNKSTFSSSRVKGWYSSLYGYKEPAEQIIFSTNGKFIKTTVSIKK